MKPIRKLTDLYFSTKRKSFSEPEAEPDLELDDKTSSEGLELVEENTEIQEEPEVFSTTVFSRTGSINKSYIDELVNRFFSNITNNKGGKL